MIRGAGCPYDAADPSSRRSRGALIAAVDPLGIAAHLGLRPGDRLLEIDGRGLRDILDYLYLSSGSHLAMRAVRPGGQELAIEIEKEEGEPLGISLAEEVFDGVRECVNDCVFCFVSQLPPGLRAPLYVRDDDVRLSVLDGNFVTLTNLEAPDWARLREQRLSPLHVSVHATDHELRQRMLRNTGIPPVLDQLRELLRLGTQVHAQVVLCPGQNDGPALDRTLGDLLELGGLASIGVVPVGVTRHAPPGLRPYGADQARAVIGQIGRWQDEHGGMPASRLWAADEWYLVAGLPLPRYGEYGDFPQLANGVGMTRAFIRDWRLAARSLPASLASPAGQGQMRRVVLVTGTMFAATLRQLVAETVARVEGLTCEVLAVENRLFGQTVTVAGLLAGQDILRAAREAGKRGPAGAAADAGPERRPEQRDAGTGDAWPRPELYLLPAELLCATGDLTLDDMSLAELSEALGAPAEVAATPKQALRAILGQAAASARGRRQARI
jgi:putative radical SAM enzyme (TIGR03279 family)